MVAVESVPVGSKLAIYHPAKKGRPGMNVRGYDLPLNPVKELPPLKGKGIKTDDNDPNLYISTIEGRIDYKPGTINIDPVFTVRGDVDQLVGKIEFYGDVVVTGNVDSGTSIRAGKNISIDGTVESATIQAGGDILLKRGIQGNQKGKIVCRGTLYADFIEQSTVEAKGNVEANAIMNCDVTADGQVILTGSHGAIIGGNTHAAKGISCTELGNDVDLATRVHVGCVNKNYQDQKKLLMREAATKKDNERIMAELQDLEILIRKTGTLNEDTDKHRKDLYAKKKQNDDDLKTVRAEIEDLQNYIHETNQSTVRVAGTIHRGVRIGIGQNQIMIDKNNSYTEYHLAGGTIEGEVFSV